MKEHESKAMQKANAWYDKARRQPTAAEQRQDAELAAAFPRVENHQGVHRLQYTGGPILAVQLVSNEVTWHAALHPAFLAGHRVYIVERYETPELLESVLATYDGQQSVWWGPHPADAATLDGVPLLTRRSKWVNVAPDQTPLSDPNARTLYLRIDGAWVEPATMEVMDHGK